MNYLMFKAQPVFFCLIRPQNLDKSTGNHGFTYSSNSSYYPPPGSRLENMCHFNKVTSVQRTHLRIVGKIIASIIPGIKDEKCTGTGCK